jgi:hypothetical protein
VWLKNERDRISQEFLRLHRVRDIKEFCKEHFLKPISANKDIGQIILCWALYFILINLVTSMLLILAQEMIFSTLCNKIFFLMLFFSYSLFELSFFKNFPFLLSPHSPTFVPYSQPKFQEVSIAHEICL